MELTSFADWKKWAEHYSVLPYVACHHLPHGFAVDTWEPAWECASGHAFVLESGKSGRYHFLALGAVSAIYGKGGQATIQYGDGSSPIQLQASPLKAVKEWFSACRSPKVPGAPKFIGGCAGYWGYDVVRSIENLPVMAQDDLMFPDYAFMMIDQLWIVDTLENRLYCAVHCRISEEKTKGERELREMYQDARERAVQMKRLWDQITADEAVRSSRWRKEALRLAVQTDQLSMDIENFAGLMTAFGREEFMRAVEKIQDYIRSGDVFQVNLSLRQSRRLSTGPAEIYEWLRLFNPSPYMGLVRFPEFQLVSASPELLVKLEDGVIATRPIAGTRRRGKTEQEDMLMANELLQSEKERAEHIMLVDLQRNDLGKVSRYGTVTVTELLKIERYSHVMHLVSEVQGRLAHGKDAFDVIAAVFPGGTITGAPKIRTMEIIEELEPVRRGPYTGSIGWIDYNGNMEFNIIIRTLLVKEGWGHVQAGAGIVIDSLPYREYKESLNKAKALWKAVQYSEQFSHPSAGRRLISHGNGGKP